MKKVNKLIKNFIKRTNYLFFNLKTCIFDLKPRAHY